MVISESSISRILCAHKFHPHHITRVQELKETDYLKILQLCAFFRERLRIDPNFLKFVLFSEEANFSSNGGVNKYNLHYYAYENPR